MNLLLSNFSDENNKDLDELLINYQEYFNFKKINDETYLYLNIDELRKYINAGKEIKYRKFIFLYIENLIQKRGKNYNFNYAKMSHKLLKYITHNKILNVYDMKNIRKLISIISYFKYNYLKIKNNNIYFLDDNLYIDIKNNRFINKNLLKDYKINFKTEGFIINNQSYLKNLIIILNCISQSKKMKNEKKNIQQDDIFIKTNCNLVITSKIKIELFTNVIHSINKNVKYLDISNISSIKNLRYKNIQECDYLFLNINILSFFIKYIDSGYNYDNKLKDVIYNSVVEQVMSETIMENSFKNIFIFNWNNIIIDQIKKINKNDLQYLKFLKKQDFTYINDEYEINDTLIQQYSMFLVNPDDIVKYGYHNYRHIIKNELVIGRSDIENKKMGDNLIEIKNSDESEIISKLNNKNNEIDLAKLFFLSKNKFMYKDNEKNIKQLIRSNNKNLIFQDNFIHNKCTSQLFCCICMDRIDNSNFCILDCCHYFCKNCILMHKMNEENNNYENKCPVCRNKYHLIYNIIDENNELNNICNDLDKILRTNNKKKIYISAENNEILTYIEDVIKKEYKTEFYKKNKNTSSDSIKLVNTNYLKKNIIKDIEVLIFFTFSEKTYEKYIEIRNLYNDYYLNKTKINFYIFHYNKK